MDLSKYTADGQPARPILRRWVKDDAIYQTFAYPLAAGVQVAVLENGIWRDFKWYPDWAKFSDEWIVAPPANY